ncbi:protein translocase subunit SecD [Candidatus Dependentiae bacterium]|nr:MAG: protein translocase subunit SecD [Candidatus Dependentiae bacterium]
METLVRRFVFSGFFFWLILAGFALYFIFPFQQKLRFGIDLVGGSYITLEVQTDKAIEAELSEKLQRFTDRFKKANVKLVSKELIHNEIILKFETPDAAQIAASLVREDLQLKVDTDGSVVKAYFLEKEAKRIAEEAVQTDIEVLRSRVDKFGLTESQPIRQGEKNIVIEFPGAGTQEAKAAIGKSAKLEFRLVEKVAGSKEDLLYEYDGDLPDDKEILPGKYNVQLGGPESYYLVERFTDLTGKLLKSAKAGIGGKLGGEPIVSITFNQTGSRRFYDLTRKNPGKLLAIILDGVVISSPQINEPISGGQAYIHGRMAMNEAMELALLLKSGAYVAPVTFEEERQVGAGLGTESIYQGLIACLLGLGLLLIFSLFYYSYTGFLAFMALLLNLILVLFGLWYLGATLTLPGIAGMVLTVGMAIDSSILIFEKIKEELALGLSIKNAVNAGFKDVMVVILDANITTFIVGAVLYWVGTGPIQGFAITLMLGIAATLVTGLFFLRSLLNFVIDVFNIKTLRI